MHSIEIPDRKETLQFASCIEEMHADDFGYMMQLIVQHQNSEITMEEFRDLLCIRLLKLKKSLRYHMMNEDQQAVVHDNFSRISELLDSFFIPIDGDANVPELNLYFIKNMIPRILNYYGPDDALTNCTFFEYKQALLYFKEYNDSKSEESLDHMIAVLYRPGRRFLWIQKLFPWYNGQQRVSYRSTTNPEYLQKRARKLRKVPMHIKFGVYLWLNNCIKFLREGRPVIDGIEIDFSILYDGAVENGIPGIGLQGIIFSLSESNVFGNIDKTADSNLYDIFSRLYQLTSDYKNQVENQKKK